MHRSSTIAGVFSCLLGGLPGCAVPVENGCASAADCLSSETCHLAEKRCVPRADAGGGPDAMRDVAEIALGRDAATPDLSPACDLDGDGHDGVQCGGDDCDEHDPTVHPGAAEDCSGTVDLNCDGTPNSGCDDDGDGACDAVIDPGRCTDCCDASADVRPGQLLRFDTATPCGGFDYDCDGVEEPELTAIAGLCGCSVPYCYAVTDVQWWGDGAVAACGVAKAVHGCPQTCPCASGWVANYTQRCR